MNEHERLLALMKEEHMNAKEFSEQVGISAATMSNIVNGRNNPSLDVMQKILQRFRLVNSDWLILGVGSMYHEKVDSQGDIANNKQVETVVPNQSIKYESPVLPFVEAPIERTPQIEKTSKKQAVQIVEKTIIKKISKILVFYTDGSFEEICN